MSLAREFLGAPAVPIPSLPFTTQALEMTSERVLDGFILLGIGVVLFGVGTALRETVLPNFRPLIFSLVCMAVFVFLGVNPAMWELQQVTVDYDRVTCTYWSGETQTLLYEELVDIRVESGKLFPMVTDDTMLVIEGQGESCRVPAFLPDSDVVVAVMEEVDS